MKYEFKVFQMQVDDHLFWVAESRFLKGCVGQGDTSEEAIKELETNESEWLEAAKEYGIPIPPTTIRREKQYSGKISLRISPFIHENAYEHSQELGISLNQYLSDAIEFYNARFEYGYNRKPAQITAFSETSAAIIDIQMHRKNAFSFEEREEM